MELLKHRERATVFSASRPGGRSGEWFVLAFRSPRTTLLAPMGRGDRTELVRPLRELGGDDPTVLVEAPGGDVAGALAEAVPGSTVFTFESAPILKFLWFFRDSEDPLLLGHAAERALLDETYPGREPPRLHGMRGAALRRSVEEHRRLLLTMGHALGVRPPIPALSPAPGGRGARSVASVLDACAGLYAGLLHRWGSPLARVVEAEGGPPALLLADAWLAERM